MYLFTEVLYVYILCVIQVIQAKINKNTFVTLKEPTKIDSRGGLKIKINLLFIIVVITYN